MQPRRSSILFTIFAPITVPVYAVFLAGANLLGAAYYVVVEASCARILGRPITLSRRQLVLWALPVLALVPIATAVHMLLWLIRSVGRLLVGVGRWQTGATARGPCFAAGAVFVLASTWITVTCLNAATGRRLIGIPVEGRDTFVDHWTRHRPLGLLSGELQTRRGRLISDLEAHRDQVHPQWERLLVFLEDDGCPVDRLPETVRRKLAGLPWFFQPAETSRDGVDHSELLVGSLLFAWVLLIRWPGTFTVLRRPGFRWAWFALRLAVATATLLAVITWVPRTDYFRFWFDDGPAWGFRASSPALWFGMDHGSWVRPEWYLFNAGLWSVFIGLVVFVWWLGWRMSPFVGWPRYYVAFLASRLLQRKRIAFFSVGAVTLCVAMMIIVISVMGGFVDSIKARAHGLLGDLVMDGTFQGFPYYQEFIDRISTLTDEETGALIVKQATPLIHSYGLLQFPLTKKTKPVRIWGIRLDEYRRVNQFGDDLFYDERYGDTTLAPRPQPHWGFVDDLIAVLPEDQERAYREYLGRLSPDERADHDRRYRRESGYIYHGPGVFREDPESVNDPDRLPTPGYAGTPFPGVIIGRDIVAHRLPSGDFRRQPDYPRGEHCFLTMLPLTRGGDIGQEPPPKPSFRYVDDSRTGIHEIDSMNVYVDFDELQRLLSMGPQELVDQNAPDFPVIGMTGARCSQIQIKLDPRFGEDRATLGRMKNRIVAEWDRFRLNEAPIADGTEELMMSHVDTQTWEEMQASFISAIEKEKFLVLIMFGVISIVAVFLILCIFYMIVQEKTRDIGIIKSVGASAEGIVAVFLAYGAAIGLVGSVLGTGLGTAFVGNINEIQEWLARLNPDWRVWSPETYSFDKIPDVWKWSEVLWISTLAILASIVGAAFPATRAGKTWPVESLRYE